MPFDSFMTPPSVLELVRECMGHITFDPASNLVAQQYVKADEFCTTEEEYRSAGLTIKKELGLHLCDGLKQDWHGNIYLNPPYSRGNVDAFVSKLIQELKDSSNSESLPGLRTKHLQKAIVLVNSQTDTRWYHTLLHYSTCALLWKGRIKFWKIFEDKAWEKWEGEKSKQEGKGKIGNQPRYLNTIFYFDINSNLNGGCNKFITTFKNTGTFIKKVA